MDKKGAASSAPMGSFSAPQNWGGGGTSGNHPMNTPKLRLTLLGIAAGILLALLVAPQTRWLVHLQALTVLHQYRAIGCESYSRSPAGDARAYDAVAARHPGDFDIQYARAAFSGNVSPEANLRALTQRFPNRPMLYANLLREESRKPLLSSAAASKLSGDAVPPTVMPGASPPEIAAYNWDASAGERTDPSNAYFPLMLAYGLFAAHRNANALAAIKRASDKPYWNEYLTENVQAKWRLHTVAFGDPGAIPQAAVWSSEMLPEYQRLRDVARIVVYQAVLKEQAGQREGGYELREDLRRCGDLMRVQSTTLLGSLVASNITRISMSRPGGAPTLGNEPWDATEKISQQRLDAYCAYVTKIGHPNAARRARDEEAARRSLQNFSTGQQMLKPIGSLQQLIYWWTAGVGLLLNIAWLLTLGLLAAGWTQVKFAPRPPIGWKTVLLHCLLAVGAWLVLALLYVCVGIAWLTFVYHDAVDWPPQIGIGSAFLLLTASVGYGLHRLPHARRIAVLRTALLLPMLVGAAYGLYCLVQWTAWPLAEIPQGLRTLLGLDGSTDSDTEQAPQTRMLWLCVAAVLLVPLLLIVTLGIVAGVKRASLPDTLTAGFRQLAVPIACVLVIAYGGVLLGTVRQERRVADFDQQMVTNSGRYFAAQAGQPWPGPAK